MFERILPVSVRVAECHAEQQVPLFPAEEAAIARAAVLRRREFVTGRACARAALAELGVDPVGIPRGAGGAPSWPDGAVGSLTHCAGFRAAAVGRAREWRSLGIDAEPCAALPEEVVALISSAAERRALPTSRAGGRRGDPVDGGSAGHSGDHHGARPCDIPWETILFSAKEAVYKAWYPLAGRFLDYPDVHLVVEADGSFAARLLVPGEVVGGALLDRFAGRWMVEDGLVLTAVTVPGGR